MEKEYSYTVSVKWTGNTGNGTADYTGYERSHIISIEGKPDILASSDTPFRGDNTLHNPEDMLVASLSTCHMLWYLHLCADAGIIVVDYIDKAIGTLALPPGKSGHFSEVMLYPEVTITESCMVDNANQLHDRTRQSCFIANSVNFPVNHKPVCKVGGK